MIRFPAVARIAPHPLGHRGFGSVCTLVCAERAVLKADCQSCAGRPGLGRSIAVRLRVVPVVAAILVAAFLLAARAGAQDEAHILVLNSYNRSNAYTQAQQNGIESQFADIARDSRLFIYDNLNAGNGFDTDRESAAIAAFRLRYSGSPIRMVITTDTPALEFMLRHATDLFPGVPIVFSAARTPAERIAASGLAVSGVRESLDYIENIRLISTLHPDVARVLAVVRPGGEMERIVRSVEDQCAEQLPVGAKFEIIRPDSARSLISTLQGLPPRTIVLYVSYRDDSVKWSIFDQLPRISELSAAPVYALYDAYVGLGVVGGYVADGVRMGRAAGEIARRVYNGEPAASIPIQEKGGLAYVFDHRQLERWNIPESRLPANSEVRFRPPPFAERYRPLLFWGAVVLAAQSMIIAFLLVLRQVRRRASRQLKAHRERLELAILGSHLGIWDWDIATDRSTWFGPIRSLLHGEESDVPGSPSAWQRSLHPDDAPRVLEALNAHLERSERYDVRYRLAFKDGQFRWFHSSGQAVRDAAGKPIRMIGTITDITDRMLAEEALRQSEERYRALIDGVRTIAWEVDPVSFRFTFVSGAAEHVLGYPLSAWFSGTFWYDHLHPDDRAWADACCREQTRLGRDHSLEYRMITADGRIVWLHDLASVVLRDGKVVGLRGVMIDITARKQAEEELEQFFRLSPGLLCVARGDRFIKVNPAFAQALGYTTEQLVSCSFLDLIHPDDVQATREELTHIEGGGQTLKFANRYRHADGTYRWLNWNAAPATPDGLIFASAQDITEERRAADAIRRSEEKFRRIVETAEEGVWVVDEMWKTTFVNARMAEMLGWTQAEMMGRHIHDFMDAAAVEQSRPNMLDREAGRAATFDFRFAHRSGRDVWTLVSTNAITDDHGQFVGALAMVTDITARRAAEEALRVSEATNLALLGAIPDLVFRMDRRGTYLDFAGPSAVSLLVPPDQFLGKTCDQVLSPERARQCMHHLEQLFTTGESQTYEYTHTREGGSLTFWEVRMIRSGEDQAVLLVRDVSAERRSEIALRAAEERYRLLVERLPQIVYTIPLAGDQPAYISPQVKEIIGVSPAKLAHDRPPLVRFVHPGDRAAVLEAYRRAESGSGPVSCEYRVIGPDGREVWLLDQMVLINAGDNSPPTLHGQALDVSEAKRAEENLRASRARLGLLVAHAPVGMIIFNSRFEITEWNPSAERIFGFTSQEVIGRSAQVIVPVAARAQVEATWRLLTSRQGGTRSINENLTRSGEVITCEWHNVPIQGPDGAVTGVTSFVQDITEKIRSDRRQALMMRELDHRVKNNMAAVVSLAEQTGRASANYQQFQESFFGRVRALSRLYAALASSKWDGTDLRAVVTQSVAPYSGEEPQRLELDGPPVRLPPRAAQSLTMAFNELATNAAKYGALSATGGRISVQWSVCDRSTFPNAAPTQRATPVLTVHWTERGGPAVETPEKRGFGTDIIEGAISYQLHGQVHMHYEPTGLRCTLVAPLLEEEPVSPMESTLF